MIKDQGKGFYNSKSIEVYITIWKLNTRTQSPSLICAHWSWVGSCVRHRLMKASHLKDRSEDGARPETLSKGPKWPLGAEAPALSASTQAPFNLPLLFASTWLERKERASHFLICSSLLEKEKLLHPHTLLSVFLQATWFSPIDVLTGAATAERGYTAMKDVEGNNCWQWEVEKGDGARGRWNHKMLSPWEKSLIILLSISSHSGIEEMKSDSCQVKDSKNLCLLSELDRGEKWRGERWSALHHFSFTAKALNCQENKNTLHQDFTALSG